jgi:hypothetical protein
MEGTFVGGPVGAGRGSFVGLWVGAGEGQPLAITISSMAISDL